MKTRHAIVALCCCCATLDLNVLGQQELGAVHQAVDEVNAAVRGKAIRLTPEARVAIANELVQQKVLHTTSLTDVSISRSEVERVMNAVQSSKPAGSISAADVKSTVAKQKIDSVRPSFKETIAKRAELTNKQLGPNVKEALEKALETQTEHLAHSGYSEERIKQFSEDYVDAIYHSAASGVVTAGDVKRAESELFQRIVNVTFESSPTGANVEMDGWPIGITTKIKPFKSGQFYKFCFSLPGYKSSCCSFYVAPFPATQRLAQVLDKE
jgi:hypothetical protein